MSVLDFGDEIIPDLGDDEDGIDNLNDIFDWNQGDYLLLIYFLFHRIKL